nr:ParA family protein [Methylobacterium sp. L1A1]
MRTIAVISQKGGIGKSTVAVHLALAGTLVGFRTALVDLDPQATARKWGAKRRSRRLSGTNKKSSRRRGPGWCGFDFGLFENFD